MYAHIERSQIKGKLDGFRVVPEWLVENDMDPMLRANPEIPPDACPLHYGKPHRLRVESTTAYTVNSWCHETEEFLR